MTIQPLINALLKIILQHALLLAMDIELSLMAIVNAIMAILMMELIMFARIAIIAGNIILKCILSYGSSHKAGDYNSCTAENARATCLICDADKKRVKVDNECKCEGGWFDDSTNE